MSNFAAFTLTANGRLREIHTSTLISQPTNYSGKFTAPEELNDDSVKDKIISFKLGPLDVNGFKITALWDTGATNSAIDTNTAKQLQLKPSGRTVVKYGTGDKETNIYQVDIFLPNGVRIPGVQVTECDPTGVHGVLIGMDVITVGDFSITNFNGKSVFSFRVPSMKTIDYVQEFNSHKNQRDRFLKRGWKRRYK